MIQGEREKLLQTECKGVKYAGKKEKGKMKTCVDIDDLNKTFMVFVNGAQMGGRTEK